jgi:hypothetical protein
VIGSWQVRHSGPDVKTEANLDEDMCCPRNFPVCSLVKLFLSFLAYRFQMQRLERELGDVSGGPHRLAAPDWLSLPALPPVVLHSPMPW